MVAIGFLVLWLGYQQSIYGWCLMKGYDITWSQLANPLNPYQWPPPGTKIPTVPAGQIMPGHQAHTATTAAPGPPPLATQVM